MAHDRGTRFPCLDGQAAVIVGATGPAVVLSAETAAFLEQHAGLSALRVRTRGVRPVVAAELAEIRDVAQLYRAPALAEAEAGSPEADPDLDEWLGTVKVADLVGISDSAVRLACRQGRLRAHQVGGRWQCDRAAVEEFRAARAA